MRLFLLFTVVLMVQGCTCNGPDNQQKPAVKMAEVPKNSSKTTYPVVAKRAKRYMANVQKIDSPYFYSTKQKIKLNRKRLAKITDFNQAKRLLKGLVTFDTSVDGDQYHPIKSINFKNGKKLTYDDGLDCVFVAYYPQEDILLCEGGHTSDVSFNLKNGERTEQTGNPDLFIFSPKCTFRLNSYFGGQECYTFFIQKKSNGQFVKVVQFDEVFEKQTGRWLCRMGDAFWTDENELYFTQDMLGAKEKQFFRAQIIAQ